MTQFTGTLKFESGNNKQLKTLSKTQLLTKLNEVDTKLVEILIDPKIGDKKVKVPWIDTPISAISSLWSLDFHEILHTSWNLAVMDHLNIKRFNSLKEMWG